MLYPLDWGVPLMVVMKEVEGSITRTTLFPLSATNTLPALSLHKPYGVLSAALVAGVESGEYPLIAPLPATTATVLAEMTARRTRLFSV
jgi:hypothetical protein